MGPVAVVVHRIIVVADEVVSGMDEAYPVVGDTGAVPHVAGQVLLVVIDPRIDHRHDHAAAVRNVTPCRHDVHVIARGTRVVGRVDLAVDALKRGIADRLAGVLECPELAEVRVIRHGHGMVSIVRLRDGDIGVCAVVRNRLSHGTSGRKGNAHPAVAVVDAHCIAHCRNNCRPFGGSEGLMESDQDFSGHILPGGRLQGGALRCRYSDSEQHSGGDLQELSGVGRAHDCVPQGTKTSSGCEGAL